MGFREDLEIDKFNLDEEVVDHLGKQVYWGERHVEAVDRRERTKANVELTRAELDEEVRRNPEDFGLDKTTEKSVEYAIIRSKRFQEATEEYLKAKFDSEMLAVGRKGMEDRKGLIQDLVKLAIADYYGNPEVQTDNVMGEVRKGKGQK